MWPTSFAKEIRQDGASIVGEFRTAHPAAGAGDAEDTEMSQPAADACSVRLAARGVVL